MISGGSRFIKTSCFVVGSAGPVGAVAIWAFEGLADCLTPSCFTVYKLDYHGPEEGEEHDHH